MSDTSSSPDMLNYDFLRAVADKDFVEAQNLLDQGAKLSFATNLKSDTPLILMAAKGEVEAVKWLLEQGADPSARNSEGITALHAAISLEHQRHSDEVVQALLDANVPVDDPDALGTRPLHLALSRRHRENQVNWLLDKGANIDTPTHLGTTPLMMALTFGKPSALRLLEMGANTDGANHEGKNVMHVAAEGDDDAISAAFVQALAAKDPDHARALLNQKAHSGTTPIALSVGFTGSIAIAQAFLTAGADPNALSANRMVNNMTCLMLLTTLTASRDKNLEAAKKKDLSARELERATKSHALLPETLALALSCGANPNARDGSGRNVLSFGITDLDIVEQLITAGADPTQPLDALGLSPFILPVQKPDELRDIRPDAKPDQVAAATKHNETVVETKAQFQRLVDLGFPLQPKAYPAKAVDTSSLPEGMTHYPSPLAMACRSRALGHVQTLLDLGADPGAVGVDGETVLHHLAHSSLSAAKQVGIQRLQQQAQARGKEAMENARGQINDLMAKEEEHLDRIVTALIDAGADVNRVNETGITPLAQAAQDGRVEMVRVLLKKGADPLLSGGAEILEQAQARHAALEAAVAAAAANVAAAAHEVPNEMALSLNRGRTGTEQAEARHAALAAAAEATVDVPNALMSALTHGQVEIVELLLEAVVTSGQLAALDSLLIDALLVSPDRPEPRNGFMTSLAMSAGLPWVSAQDEHGNTPLIIAAATGQADAVKMLLSLGADPNQSNALGETALMHAILTEEVDSIMALCAAGADIYAQDHNGLTISEMVRDHGNYLKSIVVAPDVVTPPEPIELEGQLKAWHDRRASWFNPEPAPAPRKRWFG